MRTRDSIALTSGIKAPHSDSGQADGSSCVELTMMVCTPTAARASASARIASLFGLSARVIPAVSSISAGIASNFITVTSQHVEFATNGP